MGRVKLSSSNLDMINTFSVKKKKLASTSPIVFVNSAFFLSKHAKYVLQSGNVRYAIKGLIEKAWNCLENKKYKEANQIFDTILAYSINSQEAYFGKFIVMLNQNKDAYSYLKKAIETRNNTSHDGYYRLYLKLYDTQLDISDDYQLLLEILSPAKEILAFNKNSYNGNYLEFINSVYKEDLIGATPYLDKCLEMKPNDLYLMIAKKLLDMSIIYTKKQQEEKLRQERELEKTRCVNFANLVKQNDINAARKELETILSYRNAGGKDNYIYYLFLELIETINVALEDVTFEIMPVTFEYSRPEEAMYTFFEAVTIGDFNRAYEAGKKCKGKLLDKEQSAIKVNVYLQLLDYLFKVLQEKQKEMDNIYQIIKNNIYRGQFKHALELYEINGDYLKNYNTEITLDLFNKGIDIEMKRETTQVEADPEENFIEFEDELDEIPVEISSDEYEEEVELPASEIKLDIRKIINQLPQKEEPLMIEAVEQLPSVISKAYQVQPLLTHKESQHEFFLNYVECYNNSQFEDARMWLAKFDRLLKENNLTKRLSHQFYKVETTISDNNNGTFNNKEELYKQAYNAMMNKEYESAIQYLTAYISIDENINNKGYILLGRVQTLMGNSGSAAYNYIRANSISPDPDAYYFLGELYFKKRKWNDAIFCYLAYNEFYSKENATVYLNLSECYKRVGRMDKVVKYLKIAEEINVEQKMGLYLKNRILKAEQLSRRKNEHFLLQRNNDRDEGGFIIDQ